MGEAENPHYGRKTRAAIGVAVCAIISGYFLVEKDDSPENKKPSETTIPSHITSAANKVAAEPLINPVNL